MPRKWRRNREAQARSGGQGGQAKYVQDTNCSKHRVWANFLQIFLNGKGYWDFLTLPFNRK